MDDRAATETLGFVLTFAMITAAIGIIYTGGFAGLQDARDAEQIQNVVRAFEVLGENLEDVRRYGTPSRSTEIRLLDGQLALGPQTQMIVNVSGASEAVTNPVVLVTMRPIVFTAGDDDTQISYEGGAIFRTDENTSVMLSKPGWIVSNERLILPTVQTYRRAGPNELDIRGTALVIAHSVNQSIYQLEGDPELTVNLTIRSSRAEAWARFLDTKPGFTSVGDGPGDGKIKYQVKVDRLYVTNSIIGVELSE